MAVLRSKQLAFAEVSAADVLVPVYTTPAGYRAVLRDISITSTSTVPGKNFQVRIDHSGGSPVAWLIAAAVEFLKPLHWQGDVVLDQGDTLGVYTETTPIWVLASGAELRVPVA